MAVKTETQRERDRDSVLVSHSIKKSVEINAAFVLLWSCGYARLEVYVHTLMYHFDIIRLCVDF